MYCSEISSRKFVQNFKFIAYTVAFIALYNTCFSQTDCDSFFIRGKIISTKSPKLWLTNFTLNRSIDSLFGLKIQNELATCENDSFHFEGEVQQALPVQIGWLPDGDDQIRFSNIFFLDRGTYDIELQIDDSSTKLLVNPENSKNKTINRLYDCLFRNDNDTIKRYEKFGELFSSNVETDIRLWLLLKDFLITGYNQGNANMLKRVEEPSEFENLKTYLTKLFAYSSDLQPGHKFPFESFSFGDSLRKIIKINALTLVEFWASWCGPCLEAIPSLRNTYTLANKDEFGIIGIALERSTDFRPISSKLKKYGITWDSFVDWDGFQSNKIGIREIPDNLLIAQDGTIVRRNLSVKELAELLQSKETH